MQYGITKEIKLRYNFSFCIWHIENSCDVVLTDIYTRSRKKCIQAHNTQYIQV